MFRIANGNGFGHNIIIKNGDFDFLYAHLNGVPDFEVGELVETGTIIGYSGDSETVGEPHLHMEVRKKEPGDYHYGMFATNINIEDFLTTKFDLNNNPQTNNCN